MKSLIESIRGARFIELFLLVALLGALGLLLSGGVDRRAVNKTELESRLERLLEGIEGVGNADVMISTDGEGRPVGVAVVASGALGVRTALEMQSAIQALLDIDTNRIRIIGRGGLQG